MDQLATNNYIIGGGVAGLTLAFLDKNFKVIDKNPLGQINSQYQLGPRLIQKSEYTETFLKLIDLPNLIIKTAKIGYEQKSGFIYDKCSNYFKEEYSLLTRGTREYESTFLSEGKNEIEHFVFEGIKNSYSYLFESILKTLESRNQIIHNSVDSIDTESKTISMDGYKQFVYDNLVNTVSLKILNKLLKTSNKIKELDLSVKNKNFYVTNVPLIAGDFDYIYSIQGDFTRRTYIDDYVVYESEQSKPQLEAIYNRKIVYKVENIPIQIVKSLNINKINDIHMLGRYAQWSHKVKFGEAVERSSQILKEIYG